VMLAGQPTKRFIGIDEVAALAVYLASDASKSITGAKLPTDGARTAGKPTSPDRVPPARGT
jgi:3-hydroxybutyrate dehydrogenase